MPNIFHDVMARRELFFILVGRNMKIRYKNSTLGFFWSLLSPIFLIVTRDAPGARHRYRRRSAKGDSSVSVIQRYQCIQKGL